MKHNGIELGPGSPLLTPAGARRQLGPSEADEQKALVEFLLGRFWYRGGDRSLGLGLSGKYPELMLLYAINPNRGGQGSKAARGMAKAMGLLAGMPDLCLPSMRAMFAGLYVEMKRTRGGSLGDEQKRVIETLAAEHYCVVVPKGVEEASRAVLAYLALPRGEPRQQIVDMAHTRLRAQQLDFYQAHGFKP